MSLFPETSVTSAVPDANAVLGWPACACRCRISRLDSVLPIAKICLNALREEYYSCMHNLVTQRSTLPMVSMQYHGIALVLTIFSKAYQRLLLYLAEVDIALRLWSGPEFEPYKRFYGQSSRVLPLAPKFTPLARWTPVAVNDFW